MKTLSTIILSLILGVTLVCAQQPKNNGTGTVNIKQVNESTSSEKLDTIIKLGGKKVICTIQKINATNVTYLKPGQTTILEIKRKDIEKIIFRTGKKEVFNKPVLQMVDQNSWEAVLVTENPADVVGLYKRGFVTANASSGSRSPKAAKTSATIRLQKKTAKMGALIVLVMNSEMKGGYGEVPGWLLEGIAYSDTPPADTSAVGKAIQAAMDKRNKEKQKEKERQEKLEKDKKKEKKK
jgi:hypothetical protein